MEIEIILDASPTKESPMTVPPLVGSLSTCARLLDFTVAPGQLLPGRRLLLIPSISEEAVKQLWRQVLQFAYGDGKNEALWANRFLLVECTKRNLLFDALGRLISKVGRGRTVKIQQCLSGLLSIKNMIEPLAELTPGRFRSLIEKFCFPSGAAEIREAISRDADAVHKLIQSDTNEPAIRLLCGAFLAGDISQPAFEQSLGQVSELGQNEEYSRIVKARQSTDNLVPSELMIDSLASYLKGRRVLLVEDKLKDEHWNAVLPLILGLELYPDYVPVKNSDLPSSAILHVEDAQKALERFGDCLQYFDLILLDLYSSTAAEQKNSPHLLSTIPSSISELCRKIQQVTEHEHAMIISSERDDHSSQTSDRSHVQHVPQVLIFSVASEGLTTRTLLRDFDARDYVFKLAKGDPHKATYYGSFRNSILNAFMTNFLTSEFRNNVNWDFICPPEPIKSSRKKM